MSLLCVLLIGTIVIGIIIEKKYGKSTVLNANNIKNELVCHYADNIYPIDSDCGVQYCINNNINRSFTLTKGWSNKFIYEYNKTVVDMRQYLGNEYNIYPNILDIIHIHISIEYFCCYSDDEYKFIMDLYNKFEWNTFDVFLEDLMCLNLTDANKTIYVLLLNDKSQELMRNWTDNFEQYIVNNGVQLRSKPRRYGQPFHSTIAIFDIYNENMEKISIDTVTYLNEKYSSLWPSIPITFSKENMNVS
eukprot:40875_1